MFLPYLNRNLKKINFFLQINYIFFKRNNSHYYIILYTTMMNLSLLSSCHSRGLKLVKKTFLSVYFFPVNLSPSPKIKESSMKRDEWMIGFFFFLGGGGWVIRRYLILVWWTVDGMRTSGRWRDWWPVFRCGVDWFFFGSVKIYCFYCWIF